VDQRDRLQTPPCRDVDQALEEGLGWRQHHEGEPAPLLEDGARGGSRGHQQAFVLLGDVGNGFRDRGRVRAEHRVDPVLGDQLVVCAQGGGGLRPIILDQEIELPSEDAARLVRVLDAESIAAKEIRTERRIRPRL
jgi:hypothetical protein